MGIGKEKAPMQTITQHDRAILRDLASLQREYAESQRNKDLIAKWKLHNAFRGEQPMVHLELGTFEREVIDDRLRCKGQRAREIERDLYRNFANFELFEDDKVVPAAYHVHHRTAFTPLGIADRVTFAEEGGLGHRFEETIHDLEADFHKIKPAEYACDREGTHAELDMLGDLFDGILPAKLVMNSLYTSPTQKIVHIMGMQNMFLSMYDYPALFHRMMQSLVDDFIGYFRFLERENLLLPTVDCEGLGQGSLCYTDELPGEAVMKQRPLTSRDVWGYMDSQETVGISPEMFGEFIFPYYAEIAKQFGLLSYGCCEPVDCFWEYISKFDNLRKVSICPWCDEEWMGERLAGRKTMFHRKPSPNFLGVGAALDEDGLRGHIRKSLLAAKGCTMEITQRDVYTINHDIGKARRFIAIIRDEIDKNWK